MLSNRKKASKSMQDTSDFYVGSLREETCTFQWGQTYTIHVSFALATNYSSTADLVDTDKPQSGILKFSQYPIREANIINQSTFSVSTEEDWTRLSRESSLDDSVKTSNKPGKPGSTPYPSTEDLQTMVEEQVTYSNKSAPIAIIVANNPHQKRKLKF